MVWIHGSLRHIRCMSPLWPARMSGWVGICRDSRSLSGSLCSGLETLFNIHEAKVDAKEKRETILTTRSTWPLFRWRFVASGEFYVNRYFRRFQKLSLKFRSQIPAINPTLWNPSIFVVSKRNLYRASDLHIFAGDPLGRTLLRPPVPLVVLTCIWCSRFFTPMPTICTR